MEYYEMIMAYGNMERAKRYPFGSKDTDPFGKARWLASGAVAAGYFMRWHILRLQMKTISCE